MLEELEMMLLLLSFFDAVELLEGDGFKVWLVRLVEFSSVI